MYDKGGKAQHAEAYPSPVIVDDDGHEVLQYIAHYAGLISDFVQTCRSETDEGHQAQLRLLQGRVNALVADFQDYNAELKQAPSGHLNDRDARRATSDRPLLPAKGTPLIPTKDYYAKVSATAQEKHSTE
ncbi:hypothetical protein NKR19_g1053 [Coniochaeta hoffmannii]|uniref:Uncharacterized protein n=1 Tax=Coniochaeta hoffmannii TaxID=91930 RepID=A0AA38SJ95_9PEZI|nr:hypothetical protein NKR19_g1053 [Coniochaeta hoffmannii]